MEEKREKRVNLTETRIKEFSCPPDKQQSFLWDKQSPRLAVRATANAKSFTFETKLDRKTIRVTIGACSAWTVGDAREEANRLQGLIDRNIDPREQEREEKEQKQAARDAKVATVEAARKEAEAREKYTMRKLLDAYIGMLEQKGKTRSAKAARSAFKCHILDPFPEIADTLACEVTAHQIAGIVRRVAELGKDRTAGILRSYLSAAYNAAKKAPFDAKLTSTLIPFGIEQNPVEPVATVPVSARHRVLSAEELKAYITFLGDDTIDGALRLALYAGGQRMAQLLRCKVSDYDAQTKTLRLFDGKGKRKEPRIHLLPLAPLAACVVSQLVERAKRLGAESLFASKGKAVVHYSTAGQRVAEISKGLGAEPFDLRDIRRTAETMLAGLGVTQDIRAQLLSHGISGVQAAHYDRHSYAAEKAAALRKWERHLASIEGKMLGKVVHIR